MIRSFSSNVLPRFFIFRRSCKTCASNVGCFPTIKRPLQRTRLKTPTNSDDRPPTRVCSPRSSFTATALPPCRDVKRRNAQNATNGVPRRTPCVQINAPAYDGNAAITSRKRISVFQYKTAVGKTGNPYARGRVLAGRETTASIGE